jgi:hypothetical protein
MAHKSFWEAPHATHVPSTRAVGPLRLERRNVGMGEPRRHPGRPLVRGRMAVACMLLSPWAAAHPLGLDPSGGRQETRHNASTLIEIPHDTPPESPSRPADASTCRGAAPHRPAPSW